MSLAAKRSFPEISLGTLVLAAMLPDILWCVFLLSWIERVGIHPGRGAIHYLDFDYVPFSHSLLMVAIWGVVLAGVFFLRRRSRVGSAILCGVVLSHWILDFVSDRGLPLAPGLDQKFGLELWKSLPGTLAIEGGLWLLAVLLYVRATRARGRAGVYAFWIVVVLLTLAWYNNITGPPPPSARSMGVSSLVFFTLIVAWGFWVNRLRMPGN